MRIILLIITFCSLNALLLIPRFVDAAVCQNKTVVVFSNGMFNDIFDAQKSKEELRNRLVAFSPRFSDETQYEFKLAFASDKDGLGSTFTDQLVEVLYQKQAETLSSFWRWLGAIEASPQWFQDAMTNMAGAQTALTYTVDADFQKQLNGDGTVDNPGYRRLLTDGKRVVIVSHSQGNFYANAVYSTLTTENVAWAASLGNVQVATPASENLGAKLGNNEPQITVPEDLVMKFVHSVSLGLAMPTKPLAGNLGPSNKSPNYSELGGVIARNRANYAHHFIKWYLRGTFTRYFIMNGIVQTIDGVNGVGRLQYPSPVGVRNITLDGVLPNAAATAALQYAVASGASAIPSTQPPSMRLLSTGARSLTISTCTGSGFSINKSSLGTLDGKNFLTAMGYNQDRWRFLSVGPFTWNFGPANRIDSAMSFPSLAELRAYADPRLLGTGTSFLNCSNSSIVASTRMSGGSLLLMCMN